MFRPVGSQPPSVYWRRRVLLIGGVVLLIVLLAVTIQAVTSGGGGGGTQAGGTTPSTGTSNTATAGSTSAAPSTSLPASTSKPASTASSKAAGTKSAPSRPTSSAPPSPTTCKSSALAVAAVVAKSAYKVGDTPMLELQVTNTGATPCVQDLADAQVVLKVYNGESRVWGSHDCEVQAGTSLRTLAVRTSVRVTITWSGLTSQPNDCKSRQRVGAGTYTLYASLAGKTGKATQFTMS